MKYKTLKHKKLPNTYGVVVRSHIMPTSIPELKSSSYTLDNFKALDTEVYKDFFKQLEDYKLVVVDVEEEKDYMGAYH